LLYLNLLALARYLSPEELATPLKDLTLGRLMHNVPDPDSDVHEQAVASIEAARLRRAVRSLPMLERKVIVARYGLVGQPLSCRQAAARFGLSPSSISTIEHRALDRLRLSYGVRDAA
jgi:RNA polymerase sigma factor (sigma-70 family)